MGRSFRSIKDQINFAFFYVQKQKERTEENVKVIYVWYTIRGDRA